MFRVIIGALIIGLCGCYTEVNEKDIQNGYETKHGMIVILGISNAPSRAEVEEWTDEAIKFWLNARSTEWACYCSALNNVKATFLDEPHVIYNDKAYAGLADWDDDEGYVLVSDGNFEKVRGVYIHEISHILLEKCTNIDGHHNAFACTNLESISRRYEGECDLNRYIEEGK